MPSKGQEWHANFFSQFPFFASLSVLGAVIFPCLAIFVLKRSNGQSVDSWSLSPTVYLALLSTGTNALLRFAFSDGATISWWNQALRGATIKELHGTWSYSNNFLSIIQPPLLKFNFVRLAGLSLALLVIDGPLLQRASTVRTVKQTVDRNLTLPIRIQPMWNLTTQFNLGTANDMVPFYQPEFGDVVREFNNHDPITLPAGVCRGNCTTAVTLAGFDHNCTTGRTKMREVQFGATAKAIVKSLAADETNARTYIEPHFQIDMNFDNFSVVAYIRDQNSSDSLLMYDCIFRPAFITIHLEIANTTVSIKPSSNSLNRTVEIYDYNDTRFSLTGFIQTLKDLFGGAALFDTNEYAYYFQGSSPRSYFDQSTLVPLGFANSTVFWVDPIPDLLARLDELSLRYAMKTIPNTPDRIREYQEWLSLVRFGKDPLRFPRLAPSLEQTVVASQSRVDAVYRSDYVFLTIAIAIMLVAATSVGSTMLGWWNLGREITMSPVELAKAFSAPLLGGVGSNMEVREIVRAVGDLKVQYGVPPMSQQQPSDEIQGSPATTTTLAMLPAEDTAPPRNGMVYL